MSDEKQADKPDDVAGAMDQIIAEAFVEYVDQVLVDAPGPGVRALLEVMFYAGVQFGAGNAAAGMRRFHAAADAAYVAALKRTRPILADLGVGPDAEPESAEPEPEPAAPA